jgi:hypothetical protein
MPVSNQRGQNIWNQARRSHLDQRTMLFYTVLPKNSIDHTLQPAINVTGLFLIPNRRYWRDGGEVWVVTIF